MQEFSEMSYRNKVARMSNGSGLWNQEGSHDKWQMKFEEDSEKWKFSPCSFRKRMEKRWCAINWVLITFDIEENGIAMIQLLKSTSPKQELQEFFSTKLWKAHRMFLLFCHIRLPSSGNLFEIMVPLTTQRLWKTCVWEQLWNFTIEKCTCGFRAKDENRASSFSCLAEQLYADSLAWWYMS